MSPAGIRAVTIPLPVCPYIEGMVLRFGPFELDAERDELRRSGLVLRLPHQPSRLLLMLIRRAGEVVTREEIREELWGSETHVDFEQGINAAIRQIRYQLGDNAEAPRYVKTIPRRGYVWIAPVETVETSTGLSQLSHMDRTDRTDRAEGMDGGTADAGTVAPVPAPEQPRTRRAPRMVLVATALLAVAAVVLWLPFRESRRTIAVVPFRAMGALPTGIDPRAFTQELRSTVGALARTHVVVLDERSAGDAQVRIEGTIQRAGDNVRAIVSGIDTRSRTQIWTETYVRQLGDHHNMAMQTAHLVAHEVVRRFLPPPQHEPLLRTRVPPRVLEQYRQARTERRRSLPDPDGKRAEALFEQALRRQPKFAEALSGLADIWLQRTAHPGPTRGPAIAKCREFAARALALQPENAEARAALGLIALQYEWDLTTAEQFLREAVRNDPLYVDARFNLAMLLVARGEFDDAIAMYEESRALDPIDFDLFHGEGMLYLRARRYEEAVAKYREILRFRDSNQAWWGILWASIKRHDWNEAVSILRPMLNMPPRPYGARATREEFRGLFRSLERLVLELRERGIFEDYQVAAYYSERGDRDLAFAALTRAVQNRSPVLPYLMADPRFDTIRNDPRYAAFAAKIR
jgi:DNA-binding winged helix-turn-helix (wHTH) protein/tetratricopeptide (TPR) repeat protein